MQENNIITPTATEIIGTPILNSPKISSPYYCPTGDFCGEDLLIQFNEYQTQELYQPIVSAYFETIKEEVIVVNALILIPYADMPDIDFVIGQQFAYSESGKNQLNIYITYNQREVFTNKYFPLMVTFKTNPVLNSGNEDPIETIQTFLVNEDPKTSRGTITTVKRPM